MSSVVIHLVTTLWQNRFTVIVLTLWLPVYAAEGGPIDPADPGRAAHVTITEERATMLTPPVDSLVALDGYDSAIPLTWLRPAGNVRSFNIYRARFLSGPYTLLAGGVTRTWLRDETVNNGISYFYRVAAVDDSGEGMQSVRVTGRAAAGGFRVNAGMAPATPVIDGMINAGEWASASPVIITYPGRTDTVTMFLMNDNQYLYVAVVDRGTTALPPGGGVGLFLDVNHDRLWPPVPGGSLNEGYLHWYWDAAGSRVAKEAIPYRGPWPDSIEAGSAVDPAGVTAALSASQGHLRYEASILLSSFSMAPESTLGLFVYTINHSTGTFTGTWPQAAATKLRPLFGDAGYRWAHGPFSYGDVQLAGQTGITAPVAGSPTQLTTSGFVANWSAVAGATGYRLDVAIDTAFSGFVAGFADKDVGNTTSSPVDGLDSGITYHYRVRAVGTGGTSTNSNTVTVTTLAGTIAAPVATQAKTITSGGFTATWQPVSGASGYLLDVSTDGFLTLVSGYDQLSVGDVIRTDVTGLDSDTEYSYRILAERNGSASAPSNAISLRTYVTDLSLSHQVSFPAATSLTDLTTADYRLLGIPGSSGSDIGTFLWGTWKQDWQVYWDNGKPGSASDYYVEYQQGNPDFSCQTGKAFWFLTMGELLLSGIVPAAPIDTDNVATILLTQGQRWNLITNPFERKISWTAVAAYNGIPTAPLRAWNLGWSNVTEMAPYEGYLFANDSAKSVLKIPYLLTMSGSASGVSPPKPDWMIDVVVRAGASRDQTTAFGVKHDADEGVDRYDQIKPRHFARIPDAYFDRPEWNPEHREFATDIRPPETGVMTWDLTLRCAGKEEVVVTFGGICGIAKELDVVLVDPSAGCFVDLRTDSTYSVRSGTEAYPLRVLVGRRDDVLNEAGKVVPKEFVLEHNYPNPFNPATVIGWQQPVACYIRLAVVDLLGREVTVLVDGWQPAGRFQVTFDGAQCASGVYVYRLTSGTIVLTRKMALIR